MSLFKKIHAGMVDVLARELLANLNISQQSLRNLKDGSDLNLTESLRARIRYHLVDVKPSALGIIAGEDEVTKMKLLDLATEAMIQHMLDHYLSEN